MKKLLLIALLMFALVITAVACTGDDPVTDTTVDDTTVETPTDEATEEPTAAPTDDPETTAEDPTEDPGTEPEDPTEDSKEPDESKEPETDPETTEPETEPPVDPADPVWILDAEGLAGITGTNNATIEGNEDGYVSLTATAGDPWISAAGNLGEMPEYLVIRYRTNTNQRGEIFIGNGSGPVGGESFVFDYNTNGEWNVLIFHLPTVASYMATPTVGYIRYDFFLDIPAEGTYLDVAYMAFFNTAEYALAYDFEQYPPYVTPDAAGAVNASFDTFYVNGGMYFPEDGGAGDKLAAQNNTITFAAGEAHDSMMLRGWIGFAQPIAEFGYFIDNYTMVYGDFARDTEQGVKDAGGEHASRFEITVPMTDLAAGIHTVGFVVRLEDGTVVRLRDELKVVIIPFTMDEEIILASRAGGSTPIVQPGQTMGQKFTVSNGYLKQISIADMATYSDGNTNTWNLKVWAWNTDYATTTAAEPLYSVDGENHSDNQTLNVLIPVEAMITGEVYYEVAYLSGSGGFTGWNAQGAVVEGLETYIGGAASDVHFASHIIIGVESDPNAIKMDSHNFQSNAAGNFAEGSTDDVDFLDSDLTSCFTVTYGQGKDNHCYVKMGESGPYYWLSVFNSIRTTANGAYVFALDDMNVVNAGFASMVVRANLSANPEGQLYGSDGGDSGSVSHGGSGIYLSMDGGNLIVNIKSYVDGTYVSNKLPIAIESNDIKVADNGEKVYILAGDTLVATIAISGTKDFGIANVAADALAETVTVTFADGTSQTIENAVVASRNNNGALGVATRGGGQISFTAISLMPFDSIEIPGVESEDPETPAGPAVIDWQDAGSSVKHISQDGFRYLDGDQNVVQEIVTPGSYSSFDGTLEYTKGGSPFVADFGWVAMNAETFLFGYIIDDGEPIMNEEYTKASSDPVKAAAATTGASNVSNFYAVLAVGFLSTGEHNIKVVMQQDGAEYVVIREYTIIVSE